MDKSHGYEAIAPLFINGRGKATEGIGATQVRDWVRVFPKNSVVLDLGCGTGTPVSKIIMDAGMTVYGVDASPTMVKTFRENFPGVPVACEAAEESSFFDRSFDGIISWGLVFLLPKKSQEIIIKKSAEALRKGGRFLFTATAIQAEWKDAMTGQNSLSLGVEKYRELITASGLSLLEEFEDEGENHYYHTVKR
jgi:cyclopropane fatty-acyl-phospholipid synthase-like methyltransferase